MTENVKLRDLIAKLSPKEQQEIYEGAEQLRREELTLQELRRARKLTQVKLAKKLKIPQNSVSQIEQRADLLLSTLRRTVAAMGGKLTLLAEFPDRAPVRLAGLSDIGEDKVRSRKKKKAA